jgi:hypothetical protein
LPLF